MAGKTPTCNCKRWRQGLIQSPLVVEYCRNNVNVWFKASILLVRCIYPFTSLYLHAYKISEASQYKCHCRPFRHPAHALPWIFRSRPSQGCAKIDLSRARLPVDASRLSSIFHFGRFVRCDLNGFTFPVAPQKRQTHMYTETQISIYVNILKKVHTYTYNMTQLSIYCILYIHP